METEEIRIQDENCNFQNKGEYLAPNIEVVEIEIEQNLFAGSGDLPDMGGEDW